MLIPDQDRKVLSMDIRPDGVAVIVYDVRGEPVNTLQASFSQEFEEVLRRVETEPDIKAAVIVSAKADNWVAGADIRMLKDIRSAADAERLSRLAQQGFRRLEGMRKPVVAAIHGAALGGGCELALACHARVLSDDRKTVLGLPEVQLGLLPGGNGLQRLAKMIGLQGALDLGLTGKSVRAAKAGKLGLADDVVARPILTEVAAELALQLAEKGRKPARSGLASLNARKLTEVALEKNPLGRTVLFKKARERVHRKTGGHYPAAERIVDVIETWANKSMEISSALEARYFGELVVSETARQLIGIFEATTALKKDNGADDPNVTGREVRKVAVLGGGLMGSGIAFVTLQNADIAVRIKERDTEGLARAYKSINELYAERVKHRQTTRLERMRKLGLLTGTVDFSGFADADVVVEAVFEELELKHRVLRDFEQACPAKAIFASNTSSIPIGRIAAPARNPERVVGMHYFSPVHKMPLLEVIRTDRTSPEVVATAVALGRKQGKTVIVVNDGVGFYTSRILGPLMNEAAFILSEGVPIEAVDGAMRKWGWPVGPITLLDEVGIDIAAHVGTIMVEAFGERMAPPPALSNLVADSRKGRKNGRGFYVYGGAGKGGRGKVVDKSVYKVLGIEPGCRMPAEEIQMRCSLQFVNEAIRCMGDGILRNVRDGDIGAVFGLGFPPFRGGPFRYMDAVGATEAMRRIDSYFERFGKRWEPAPLLVELARTGRKFYP